MMLGEGQRDTDARIERYLDLKHVIIEYMIEKSMIALLLTSLLSDQDENTQIQKTLIDMELKGGFRLYFDRVDKTYYTKNRKYIIKPPLSNWLRSEILPDSDLAITNFVLRTCNATMYVQSWISSFFMCKILPIDPCCGSCILERVGPIWHLAMSCFTRTSVETNDLVPHRFFLEELRVQGYPFDEHTFAKLDGFCRRPVYIGDEVYEDRRRFLKAFASALEQANQGRKRQWEET